MAISEDPRAQDGGKLATPLVYSVPLDQEGKTCTDNQDYSPYGTKRQPLSSDPFDTTGLKKGLGDPVG
jgi:hypothetical protein